MGLIALAVALLVEQVRPLRPDNRLHRLARECVDLARQHSSTERPFDAVLGWIAVVAASIALVVVLQWVAAAIGSLASFLLHVGILYLTIGFRQLGHNLREVLAALGRDDPARARHVLEDWIAAGEGAMPVHGATVDAGAGGHPGRAHGPFPEVARVRLCRAAITHALVCAHREFFGPVLAYLLLPGAIGPVAYRMVDLLARRWTRPLATETVAADTWADGSGNGHARGAARGMEIVDWIPLRVTAAGFAIAGDFEDSTYCWRSAIAAGAGHDQRAMLVAVGSGSLGLDLVDPDRDRHWAGPRAEGLPPAFDWRGAPPDAGGIRSTIGLVWRAATLVIGLFVLVALSGWLGR